MCKLNLMSIFFQMFSLAEFHPNFMINELGFEFEPCDIGGEECGRVQGRFFLKELLVLTPKNIGKRNKEFKIALKF